ncbi:MAG: hypothetical protein ACE5PT_05895 [Gemmatimonadales bacterium]
MAGDSAQHTAHSVRSCSRCGHELEVLSNPIKRLRWTKHWWRGFKSLFTGQLHVCTNCGAMYASDGALVAAGAIATDEELRLDTYRRDMAHLRDAFGGVIIAAEILIIWLVASGAPEVEKLVGTLLVGGGSVVPFGYFHHKASTAKRDLKRLRESRKRGLIPHRHSGD